MLRLKPHNSIMGLVLYLETPGGETLASMKVPTQSLDDLAAAAIRELNGEVSPALAKLCKEVAVYSGLVIDTQSVTAD